MSALNLRVEPFEFEAEFAGEEWQSEVNRSSRDYIKWVQQSLNRIMGLKLAVDGDLGTQTRSAIRSFQQRRGLRADGLVGAQTEAAIKTALDKSPAPTSPGGIPPQLQPKDYAAVADKILSRNCRKCNRSHGIVLSVVQVIPADGKAMIDTRTEGGTWRPRLKNPPAHVVMPAEVYEIEWKKVKLRYVWILSSEKAIFPVGGVLILPQENGTIFYLVTFNTGKLDDGKCTNVHHAEMQAVSWINAQPGPWRSRVGAIDIWNLSRQTGLGYSPCNACCVDLARFLWNLPALQTATGVRASITWLTLYDKNRACGHPTDAANLRKLASSGWTLNGPGWSSSQPRPRQAALRS